MGRLRGIQRWAVVTATVVVGLGLSQPAYASARSQAGAVPSSSATVSTPGQFATELESVSCATTSQCVAVGPRDTGRSLIAPTSGGATLAEVWDGNRWSVARTPNPKTAEGIGTAGASLTAVSCPARDACMAIGEYLPPGSSTVQVPLAELWDGTGWTLEPVPVPPSDPGSSGSRVTNISCSSIDDCMAVGTSTAHSSGGVAPLAEHWDGKVWSPDLAPAPGGGGYFDAVSCLAGGDCVALGSYEGGLPFLDLWNGTTWSRLDQADPAGLEGPVLSSLWCGSPSDCLAAGYQQAKGEADTLALAWNGTSWKVQRTPNPTESGVPSDDALTSISCTSPVACTAVGYEGFPSRPQPQDTISMRWDGSSWSILPGPPVYVTAVSCAAPGGCTAVGGDGSSTSYAATLNGTTWAPERVPGPTGSIGSLNGVSCPSGSCVVVGAYQDLDARQTVPLIEVGYGSAYKVQPSPSVAGGSLEAVSCASTASCLAIGVQDLGAGPPLVELWDGSTWSLLHLPAGSNASLASVSCPAAHACTAVGEVSPTATKPERPVADEWNGSTWTVSPLPLPAGSLGGEMDGVSCVTAARCEAVGSYFNGSDREPLVERWDGTGWAVQASATPGGASVAQLYGVSCATSSACQAVGYLTLPSGTYAELAESFTASGWTVEPTPQFGKNTNAVLSGVSCSSATACTAVGQKGGEPLAEALDGSTWTVGGPALPAGATGTLRAVACQAASSCTAVGTREVERGFESAYDLTLEATD